MIDTATLIIVSGAVLLFALFVSVVNVPKCTEAVLDVIERRLARR